MQDLCSPGKCSYVFLKDSTDFTEAGEENGPTVILPSNVAILVPTLVDQVRKHRMGLRQ